MATKSNTFSKSQFLKSKTYENYRDFLGAVLSNDKQYTKEEVNKLIKLKYEGK